MLLVCGGKPMIELGLEPMRDASYIPHYPPVLAIVAEDDTHTLPALMANIYEPFIVRLSDKDLVKIINSKAGKKALRDEKES